MPGLDSNEFFDIFIQEATEQIQNMDQALVAMESRPRDSDLVDEVFRAAHSLKAAAASQGFEQMSRIAHAIENVLDEVRGGRLAVSSELIDLLLSGVDALKTHLQSALQGQQAPADDFTGLLAALRDAAGQASSGAPCEQDSGPPPPPSADSLPADAVHLRISILESCPMPAARAWLILSLLREHGDVLFSDPSPEALQGEDIAPYELTVSLASSLSADELLQIACGLPEVADVQLLATPPSQSSAPSQPPSSSGGSAPGLASPPEQPAPPPATPAQQTVRINVEHIDALMNLVGELVINRTRLSNLQQRFKEAAASDIPHLVSTFQQLTGHLATIVTELQERVMQTRMVPIEQVFMRFPRLVRDAARREGKQVEFLIEGRDTELDTGIIQNIVDPLSHLLRNAVAHGIEPPDQRRAAGKPPQGRVTLGAYQEGSNIIIFVRDDGAGIDPEQLRRAAVQKGLLTQAQASALSDQQARELIFTPGFSTSAQVNDVSGRGVGMDVVRANIEKIGGQVEITSTPGAGTTISLCLPLTSLSPCPLSNTYSASAPAS